MYTQPQIKYMAANKQAVQDAVNRMDVLIDKLTALVQSVHAVNNEDAQAPERVLMRMYTRELRSVFDSIDEFFVHRGCLSIILFERICSVGRAYTTNDERDKEIAFLTPLSSSIGTKRGRGGTGRRAGLRSL